MLPTVFIDRITNKFHLYNFEQIGKERAWLRDVLLSDSSSNDSDAEAQAEEEIKELLYLHH